MLDTHCKVHANYPDSTVTATLRSDGPTNGSGRPQPRHLDLITPDVYGRFVEGLSTGTFNDTIAAAAMYTPQSNPSAGHEDHSIDGAAVGGNPLPTSPSSVSPTSLSLSGRFHCSHQGCTTSCARPADLRRHALKHSAGARAFGCPNAGCPRKGSRAFDRKDKMLSHSKVCRAGARTGGSETQEA